MDKREWEHKKAGDTKSLDDTNLPSKKSQASSLQATSRIDKINKWLKDHQNLIYVILVLIMIGSSAILIVSLNRDYDIPVLENSKLKKRITVSPLTGLPLKDAGLANRPVTAVMIENSPDARPQSGLAQAGVVFEAVAEGGITRFEALYQEAQPKLVGPVRSLRPYYFDWSKTFDASVAHVGGSSEALRQIRATGQKDLDQFFNPSSYWRSTDRYAPHNVYTSFDKLTALNKSKGYKTSKFTPLARIKTSKAKPSKTPTAKLISVDISSDQYNPSFRYNPKTNDYSRHQAGAPHTDRETKKAITPKVVVVLQTPMKLMGNSGYMNITTTGSGKAYIFQNGNVVKATWIKPSNSAQFKFIDSSKKSVLLNPGMTWFSVISTEKNVKWQ